MSAEPAAGSAVAEGRPGRGRARASVRAPDAAADVARDRRGVRPPRHLQGRAPAEGRRVQGARRDEPGADAAGERPAAARRGRVLQREPRAGGRVGGRARRDPGDDRRPRLDRGRRSAPPWRATAPRSRIQPGAHDAAEPRRGRAGGGRGAGRHPAVRPSGDDRRPGNVGARGAGGRRRPASTPWSCPSAAAGSRRGRSSAWRPRARTRASTAWSRRAPTTRAGRSRPATGCPSSTPSRSPTRCSRTSRARSRSRSCARDWPAR